MNKDEITRMYEKANGWSPKGFENTLDDLERFAALVAAAEREACAKVCDEPGTVEQWDGLSEAADRIRARGQA
jgi:hypothetical protein